MLKRIRALLEDEKLDAIFVTNTTDIRYFSNFTGTNGTLLLAKKCGFLFTDFRYHLVAKKVLPSWIRLVDITDNFQKPWRRIQKKYRLRIFGYAANVMTVSAFSQIKKYAAGAKWRDIGEKLAELRIQKSKEELHKIQKAQYITDKIFSILKKNLKKGQSEKEIAWNIQRLCHELDADDISFPPIIGINEHSASPHHQNTDRKLKKGDLILIDMGFKYQGYCSDMTRVLFTRLLRSFEQKIYTIVWEAQECTIRHLKAGITGKCADAFSRDHIKKAGYGKYFGHSLGHGVGLDIHELPNLSRKYDKPIPEHSVVTVEPGIYLEGKFGIRLEDMVYVQQDNVINLTKSPKTIRECIIKL